MARPVFSEDFLAVSGAFECLLTGPMKYSLAHDDNCYSPAGLSNPAPDHHDLRKAQTKSQDRGG
jgi:hypothetical protein